jgi:hypothetical protein
VNTNSDYTIDGLIYLLGLICGIPVLTMMIFGYLTYRNIHLTRILAEQQADRQLAKMTLIQVIMFVICIVLVPYSIFIGYSLITSGVSKYINRLIIASFILMILSLVCYFYLCDMLIFFMR